MKLLVACETRDGVGMVASEKLWVPDLSCRTRHLSWSRWCTLDELATVKRMLPVMFAVGTVDAWECNSRRCSGRGGRGSCGSGNQAASASTAFAIGKQLISCDAFGSMFMCAGQMVLVPNSACFTRHHLWPVRSTLDELATVRRMLPIMLTSGTVYAWEVFTALCGVASITSTALLAGACHVVLPRTVTVCRLADAVIVGCPKLAVVLEWEKINIIYMPII